MKFALIIFILFIPVQVTFSQAIINKPSHKVVIDTDCGIDDYRSIAILLARPEISLKGISISDGNIPPEDGYIKVRGLLKAAGFESIPVGYGKTLPDVDPEWRDFNRTISWGGDHILDRSGKSSYEMFSEVLDADTSKLILLFLGPLTNLAELIKKRPDALSRIERVIWYNENFEKRSGFNYLIDSLSANKVFNSGVRIDIVSNLEKPDAMFDLFFLSGQIINPTDISVLLTGFYKSNLIPDDRFDRQLELRDELAAVYLLKPELFDTNTLHGNRQMRYVEDYNLQAVNEVIRDIITGVYSDEEHVSFSRFPLARELYNYDVRQIMDETISRHGPEEWKASILTNEFHRHLGIYSIIGVKMGIRALEALEAGRDMLIVRSFAGLTPPYSCLNDGIQVSTGATLGMGLISVNSDPEIPIMAEFGYNGKRVRLSLKKEYLEQIEFDIQEGIVKYGLLDDGYWKLIRQSALKYWMEWDRNEIFFVEEIL